MKKVSIKLISAVLTVCMLLTMMSCLFGITASADITTYDSGNMPSWWFEIESWGDTTNNIKQFSDGSTRFTTDCIKDFGTDLSGEEITYDFKSNGGWMLYLRTDETAKTTGYIVGTDVNGNFFIKRASDSYNLAACSSGNFHKFSYNEWHRYSIRLDDYKDHTVITVTVDGEKIPLCEGYGNNYGQHYDLDYYDVNAYISDGKVYDYNPVQTGNTYIKVSPRQPSGAVNQYSTMYFRSIDADLTDKKDTFRIALAGDSITHGQAQDENGVWCIAYNKLLNEYLGYDYDVYNGGVSGAANLNYGLYNGANHYPYSSQNQMTYVNNFDADLVLTMLGTNDAAYFFDTVDGVKVLCDEEKMAEHETNFKSRYTSLVKGFLDKGIQVVVVSAPYSFSDDARLPEAVQCVAEWAGEVAAELSVPFVDIYELTNDESLFYDKTHPNMAGKTLIAQTVYNFITDPANGVNLTKTNPDSIEVPEQFSNTGSNSVSYSGKMNTDNFNASKYYSSSASECIKYIDGNVAANFGAVSKYNYDLGTKWTATFENEIIRGDWRNQVTDGNYTYDLYRSSNFDIGGLTLKIYQLLNKNTSAEHYVYRLLLNGKEIADPCITDSYTAKVKYSIEYNNGSVKVSDVTNNKELFNVDSITVTDIIGADYRFDNVGVSAYAYQYNKTNAWYTFSVEAADSVVSNATVTCSDHGHVEYAGKPIEQSFNGKTFYVGQRIILTAVADDEGYAFLKWVDGDGNYISSNPIYAVTLEENTTIHAVFDVYKPYGEFNLTATVGGTVLLNGTAVDPNVNYEVGTTVTLNAVADTGYTFSYWTNSTGKILSTDADYEITVPKLADFKAVFTKNDATTVTVLFANRGGVVVAEQTVTKGETVTLPSLPTTFGYVCNGWAVGEEVLSAGDEITVSDNMIIRADYTKETEKYTVTVSGGTVNGSDSGVFTYNTKVTVQFDTAMLSDGVMFGGWHVEGIKNDTSVISYDETYTFYVGAGVTLTAVIVSADVEVTPIIDVTNVANVNSGKQVTFLTERNVPSGYTLVESGVIYTADATKIDMMTLDNIGTNIYQRTATNTSPNGQFRMTLTSRDGSSITVYLAAYMTYIDELGKYHTVYSDTYTGKTVSNSGNQDIIDEETDNF